MEPLACLTTLGEHMNESFLKLHKRISFLKLQCRGSGRAPFYDMVLLLATTTLVWKINTKFPAKDVQTTFSGAGTCKSYTFQVL